MNRLTNGSANAAYTNLLDKTTNIHHRSQSRLRRDTCLRRHATGRESVQLTWQFKMFRPERCYSGDPCANKSCEPRRRTRALAGRPGRLEGRAGRGRGAGAAAARQHRDLPAQIAVGLLQRRHARMLHSPEPASKIDTYAHRHKHAHNKQSEPQNEMGCSFRLTLTYTHIHTPTQNTLKLEVTSESNIPPDKKRDAASG